jgi:hypothetical protein
VVIMIVSIIIHAVLSSCTFLLSLWYTSRIRHSYREFR